MEEAAEERARSRHAANSNLVVPTVPSGATYHFPTGEPEILLGEPETLWGRGRMRARSFGYEPRTKETRATYEALLSLIQQQIGGQPPDVLGDAADKVLATLKNDKATDADKKKEIEKRISPISNRMFEQLVSVAKLITDFRDASDGTNVVLDDCIVEFYDEEEME